MDKIAGSGNDEYYTPEYAILPLLEFIPFGSKIWCPFDTKESLFYKILTAEGCEVIISHINENGDFFKMSCPDDVDFIISNPPYSLKNEVFEKLFSMRKPFAMLVGVSGIFESQKRFNLFKNNAFEIMYFDKRISYFKSYTDKKTSLNPPFSSVYICSGMLPSKIIFKNIVK